MTTAPPIPTQRAARYACEHATPDDADAIRRLLQMPMPGRVSFAMTHGPDHAAAVHLASERVDEVVVRDTSGPTNRVVGYGYRAVRSVYLNGSKRRCGYLGGLRCDSALRAAFRVLSSAFDTLAQGRRNDETSFDLTSIMADNRVVRRGLEKGLPGLPTYTPIGEMATLTIDARRHARTDPRIRSATTSDAGLVQQTLDATGARYQARHAWHIEQAWRTGGAYSLSHKDFLLRDTKHAAPACVALCDQRALKQIVVAGLSPALGRGRHAINLAAKLTGRPALPPAGSPLNMAYISHAAFDLDDADTASALIAQACALAATRGIKLVSLGLPADTPILPALTRRFKPWISRSIIYAVGHLPDAIRLDGRPVWMEVATL
jgi:hypothetical protein